MAFKFVLIAALVSCARAGFINPAPLAYSAAPAAPLAYAAAPAAPLAYAAAPAPALAYKTYAAPAAYAPAPAALAYKSYAAAPAIAAAPIAYKSYAAPAVAYAAAPVAKAVVAKTVDEEYDPNPQYSYSYDVHDSLTGDAKSQQETRNGDAVQGSYSLLEADGTRRIVEYTADSQNGFNAVVHKEPAAVAVKAAVPVVAKAAIAAPAYPAPLAYKSPAYY